MVIKFPIRYSTGAYYSAIDGIWQTWQTWHYRGWEITKFIDKDELFIGPMCDVYDYAKTLKQAISIVDRYKMKYMAITNIINTFKEE